MCKHENIINVIECNIFFVFSCLWGAGLEVVRAQFEFGRRSFNEHFDSGRLLSLKFNPLSTDLYFNQRLTLANDLDPDSSFYSDLNSCDYLVEDQFNDILNCKVRNKEYFSSLHLNIRSLQANLDGLTNLLSNLNMDFSVIAVTETWTRDTTNPFDIENFKFVYKHRTCNPGGGVGLYLTKQFRADLNLNNNETAESLFIEIVNPRGKNIIVGVIYRPPNTDVNLFIHNFDELLGKISREQ